MTHEEMERKKRAILQSLAEGARAESAAPDEDDEEDGDIFVSTVTEAIALLLMHKEPGGARYRRRLIRFITDPKHQVYDSPNIYHNFVMHLFKLRDYIAALEVCDFVLRFAPQSRDILGDAIACGESCQFERGERYLARGHGFEGALVLASVLLQCGFSQGEDDCLSRRYGRRRARHRPRGRVCRALPV